MVVPDFIPPPRALCAGPVSPIAARALSTLSPPLPPPSPRARRRLLFLRSRGQFRAALSPRYNVFDQRLIPRVVCELVGSCARAPDTTHALPVSLAFACRNLHAHTTRRTEGPAASPKPILSYDGLFCMRQNMQNNRSLAWVSKASPLLRTLNRRNHLSSISSRQLPAALLCSISPLSPLRKSFPRP